MKPKITMRKFGGTDRYSWAVLVDGEPLVTGVTRTEAGYHRRHINEMYAAKEARR